MWILLLSFVAWVLTVLAPCVLPILPVIVWWSVVGWKKSRPWLIILSFAISIIVFTLILQRIVQSLGVRPETLTTISASILVVFGIFLLFPSLWQKLMHITWLEAATSKAQQSSASWVWWDIILWWVLGPVFNTCSPTYAILVATILPASFLRGLTNIIAYVVWLSLVLSLVAYFGRYIVNKLKWAASPTWRLKKTVAILLILVWVSMFMKWDKQVEARLLQNNIVIDTTQREIWAVQDLQKSD